MVKVLLIDDDEAVHALIREQIHVMGAQIDIVSACGGADGVSKYATESPDLVIMDIRMPGEDGITITKRIMRQHPEAKIVILTGFPEDAVSETFNAGAFALVKKAGTYAALIVAFIVAFANGKVM